MIILAGTQQPFWILLNYAKCSNCAKWILKVEYFSISKQQKKFGVSEMQGSGTGNPTIMAKSVNNFDPDWENRLGDCRSLPCER